MTRIIFTGRADAAIWRRATERIGPFCALITPEDLVACPISLGVVGRYNAADLATSAADLCVAFEDNDTARACAAAGIPTVDAEGNDVNGKVDNPMPQHEFLWIDLETTGLDPATGKILEFAAVLCEDGREGDFAIVAEYTSAVHHEVAREIADDYVKAMHDANGLWNDVAASALTLADAERFLCALADDLTGDRRHAIVLAGNSVHFDLAWLRVWMPEFATRLSHRVFDVTTLRRVVDAWGVAVEWPARDAHRALDDIRASIAEARIARHALGLGVTP